MAWAIVAEKASGEKVLLSARKNAARGDFFSDSIDILRLTMYS